MARVGQYDNRFVNLSTSNNIEFVPQESSIGIQEWETVCTKPVQNSRMELQSKLESELGHVN